MLDFDAQMRRGGEAAIQEAGRFFMHQGPVHQTLYELAAELDRLQVSYAIAGGMALVAHGYARTTVDVDVIVSQSSLDAIHDQLSGRGYLPPFEGGRNLRDTRTGVRIEFRVSGAYPGDGKPKPVAFPDPDTAATIKDGVRYVALPKLIELKLASGMTNPGRLRDLADVQELIRTLNLKAEFVDQLNEYVRQKFLELQQGLEGH